MSTQTKQNKTKQNLCPWMFIPASSIIAKTWKQPRCLSGEWMNKLRYIQTMEYLFSTKNN